MIGLLASAYAGPPITVPFPASRVFEDERDKVCLKLPTEVGETASDTQMADFDVACTVSGGWMTVCLTLSSPAWPERPPPVECGRDGAVVRMRPRRSYFPDEDIWDGVALLKRVDIYKAVYRVDHPDAPGLMHRGECGITDGLFWFETLQDTRKQECILVMEDDTERVVPIRLVGRLAPLGK